MFSRKDLMKILLPLFVEQLLAVTIGMLDSMMVSSAGEAAVSGVSLVDSINVLLSNVFVALATGGSVVCSQLLGRKDYLEARASAKQLIHTGFYISLLILAVALLFRMQILRLIFGSVSASVMANASIYFLFTSLSYPFLALYNSGAAIFRAMGNSKISMKVSVFMNLLNVCGNALLIFGFHLGAAGAAIATLFSRIVGSVLMISLLYNKNNSIYIEKLFSYRPDFRLIRRILHIGVPNGMENGMFQFGKLLTQSLISTFGTAAIAANAVSNVIASFVYAAGGSFGIVMITVVGRCVGAGEEKQAKQYAKKLIGIEYLFILVVTLILTAFAGLIIRGYDISDTALAWKLILIHNVASILIWPLAFTLPYCFRAASDVTFSLVVSVCSMWTFRVALSYVLARYFNVGAECVWIAMIVDWIFRTTMFVLRFISDKWFLSYRKTLEQNS